jgi:hypothetical protein
MNFARIPAVLLSLAFALTLAACGEEEQPAQRNESFQSVNAQVAETEGIYLDVDGLKYQVQISRQLNPGLIDDRDYLQGLSEEDRSLSKDEEWFGVWLMAENVEEEALPNATDFEIRDTQENVYRPMQFGPDNVFAYRGTRVEGGERYPNPNSPAGERQPYGSLLLFKLRRFSLDNRPLELTITGPEGQQAIVNLDV